jgi:sulfatase maturation enzyme AslB (radical SAM superfamily)
MRVIVRGELLMQAHDAARPLDTDDPFGRMDSFVEATRAAVHVRRVDKLLMLRPEKTLGVNDTALDILEALYRKNGPPAREALTAVAARYGVALDRLAADAQSLLDAIRAMMREDFQPQKAVRYASFERGRVKYPVLAEIALTWKCQNRCAFCYAASPSRKDPAELMSSAQVERVIDRIYEEAHVPSLSFTGGEATLRRDLPALVQYASARGLRTNLITNGLRASRYDFAARLVDSGLASAQVSIEADEAGLHDRVVGRRGAFARTVAGIRNFRRLGIHVHTNTTLCQANLHRARDIVRFVALELGLPTMSMNMLIRTGMGLDPASAPLSYAAIAEVLPGLLDEARQHKLKLVW